MRIRCISIHQRTMLNSCYHVIVHFSAHVFTLYCTHPVKANARNTTVHTSNSSSFNIGKTSFESETIIETTKFTRIESFAAFSHLFVHDHGRGEVVVRHLLAFPTVKLGLRIFIFCFYLNIRLFVYENTQ